MSHFFCLAEKHMGCEESSYKPSHVCPISILSAGGREVLLYEERWFKGNLGIPEKQAQSLWVAWSPCFLNRNATESNPTGLMLAGLGNPLCFPFLLCYLLETSDTMEMSHRLYFTREVRVVTGEQRKYLTTTLLHIDFIDFHFLHPYIRDRKSSHEDWKHILPFLTSLTYRGYLYPRNISNGFLNHAMSFMTIIKDPF